MRKNVGKIIKACYNCTAQLTYCHQLDLLLNAENHNKHFWDKADTTLLNSCLSASVAADSSSRRRSKKSPQFMVRGVLPRGCWKCQAKLLQASRPQEKCRLTNPDKNI